MWASLLPFPATGAEGHKHVGNSSHRTAVEQKTEHCLTKVGLCTSRVHQGSSIACRVMAVDHLAQFVFALCVWLGSVQDRPCHAMQCTPFVITHLFASSLSVVMLRNRSCLTLVEQHCDFDCSGKRPLAKSPTSSRFHLILSCLHLPKSRPFPVLTW
jgi:hypothetical protein